VFIHGLWPLRPFHQSTVQVIFKERSLFDSEEKVDNLGDIV
jgi:hypothetical protein